MGMGLVVGGRTVAPFPPGANTGGGPAVENRGMLAMAAGDGMLPMLVCTVPDATRVAAGGAEPVVVCTTAGAKVAGPGGTGTPGCGHPDAAGMCPPAGCPAGHVAGSMVGGAVGATPGTAAGGGP